MHGGSKLQGGMEDLDLKGLVTSIMSFRKTNPRFVSSAEGMWDNNLESRVNELTHHGTGAQAMPQRRSH
jgi:hypothetical protein